MSKTKPSLYEDMTKTATFVLTLRQIVWIQGEFVRSIVDAAISEQERAA
jgi:hypothetical protein